MKIACIIPARFASSRLPGKPLLPLGGSPIIEWVYKRACAARLFKDVVVATDDTRIKQAVEKFGGHAEMTPENIATGTDRVAFVARSLDAEIIVNLQGDEPLIWPRLLEDFCSPFSEKDVVMTTPVRRIKHVQELIDPNLVRVVLDHRGDALYFSRSAIPFVRDEHERSDWLKLGTYYRHIGLYAYRRDFLLHIAELKPGRLERLEKLEQLRVLEYGFKIRTVLTDYNTISVDTQEDYKLIKQIIQKHKLQVDKFHEYM